MDEEVDVDDESESDDQKFGSFHVRCTCLLLRCQKQMLLQRTGSASTMKKKEF